MRQRACNTSIRSKRVPTQPQVHMGCRCHWLLAAGYRSLLIGAGLILAALSGANAQTGGPAKQGRTTPTAPAESKEKVLPSSPAPGQPAAPRLRLENLEKMALANNPTLAQAAADVRAAAGRAKQAGLYPNPVIGASGEEISSGPIIRGGELGGFLEQRFVTGGKLGLSRRVAEQERVEAESGAQAQRYRVLNAVRSLYYRALGDEVLVQVRGELAKLARRAVEISRELANVGQADRPDLMAAEVEAQRLELNLLMAQNARERTWRQLAAVVNNPSLKPTQLEGDLENVPKLDLEQALATIYSESPEIRTAEAATTRTELAVRRAQVEKIPDIFVRGGVRYNRELLEQGPGGTLRPVGPEGLFDVNIQIPIFNRNQGNVAAAKAEAERARLDVERTKLALRSRLAAVYKEYQDALTSVERYRTRMIPVARQAYELYLNSFRQMAAAYPQVLIAQRNLFQLQEDYVAALVSAWQSTVEIQGLLLTGGIELSEIPSPRPAAVMRTRGGQLERERDER